MDTKYLLGSAATLAYFADLQSNNINEYLSNENKYKRFLSLIEYCKHLEQEYDCEMFRCVFNPKWIDGSVEMVFHGEWAIHSDVFPDFMNALKCCDGLNIAVNPLEDDWVQVTFFVKNLWEHNK